MLGVESDMTPIDSCIEHVVPSRDTDLKVMESGNWGLSRSRSQGAGF